MDVVEDINLILDNDLIELFLNRRRKRYTVRPRTDNLNAWDDQEFINRFRLSKNSVQALLEQIREQLTHPTDRNNPILPLQQLLLTLRFLATGSFYITIADFGGIHKSTFGKIVQRVIYAIAHLAPNYIRMPATFPEQQNIVLAFHRVARFPRVIGCIDCTHIKILSPDSNIAENFRNRKGFFSLNVQAVCDANNVINDIVVRWPGACHDSYIFNNSALRMRFEAEELPNLLLLGDSGYPLRSYLLTPLENPTAVAEQLYNEAQIRTRNIVERTFGIWKRRFPILSVGIRSKLPLTQAIIVATAVLHNIARTNRDELPRNEEMYHDANINILDDNNVIGAVEEWGNIARQEIIDYFQQLLNEQQ